MKLFLWDQKNNCETRNVLMRIALYNYIVLMFSLLYYDYCIILIIIKKEETT